MGFVAALIATSITVVHACCQMNGTTVGCAGTRNFLVVCKWCCPVPEIVSCTGTSPGSTYPDATGGNATGTTDAYPAVGGCSATVTYAAGCCGGAVTTGSVYGFYGYANCGGSTCP